jgi:hypothetical protein
MSILTPEQEKIIKESKVGLSSHTQASYELDKQLCIMELVNVVQRGKVSDDPPCVSRTIRNVAIQINDECANDISRAQLKKLVPKLIHTAPTRHVSQTRVVTAEGNREYLQAEKKRGDLLQARLEKVVAKYERLGEEDNVEDYVEVDHVTLLPFTQQLRLLEELADIARFD